jgi:flagellar hook-associated protein 2
LGISVKLDGTLALDATKLASAEAAQPGAVAAVFAGENGLAARLEAQLARVLAADGDIALRDKGISTRRKDLESRQEALELRMVSIQTRYLKQFSALDTLLARMQTTASYLTQQLATSTQLAKDSGN